MRLQNNCRTMGDTGLQDGAVDVTIKGHEIYVPVNW